MKRVTILLPLFALMFTLVAGAPAAQPGKGRAGKGPDSSCTGMRKQRMFEDLKLTEEQQTKLKALHEEMMSIRNKHRESVKGVRDKMKTELLKKSPSQKVLNGYAGELGELHKNMTKDRTAHLLKVKKVLTPEQFSKLVEKEDRMKHGGCGRHMRSGKCPHRGECPHKKNRPHRKKGGPKGECPHKGAGNTSQSDTDAKAE